MAIKKIAPGLPQRIIEKINEIIGGINSMDGDISTAEGDITDIQGDVTDIQGDITDIQGDITTIQGNVTTAQGDITSLGARVTALENAGSGASGYIIEMSFASPTDPPTITDGTQCDALAAAIAADDPIADVVLAMTVSGSVQYLHCDIVSQTGPVLRNWTSATDADIFTFAESDGTWSATLDSIAYATT